jgi:hypothetical protein
MLYQLPNGKVIYLTIEQYLDLTDLDIQFLMSVDAGDYALNPFTDSAISRNTVEKQYDFDYLVDDDNNINEIESDDIPFDDIIDLSDSLKD